MSFPVFAVIKQTKRRLDFEEGTDLLLQICEGAGKLWESKLRSAG
jgi:hypothetical protein